ncbi:L,D-transpeptidase [Candidatus Woesearchaeota archaeon]|nr:L,D-transpeptidase [Candidatus Woesearchaeota archaeon]
MGLEEEFSKIYLASQADGLMLFVKNSNLYVFDGKMNIHFFPCSTSKNGFGFELNSQKTPSGLFRIAQKIGDKQPLGMEFIERKIAGLAHINRTKAPLESKVLTRILWLSGLDKENSNTLNRFIYIHGTANEWAIGTPITNGCIVMRNNHIVQLVDIVVEGTLVYIFGE